MPIVISRKDLYERVWAEPIQKLSKEYGLSDVGLAKVCRRYNIPIPPRGYWAKKQAGKRVAQPPLAPQGPQGYGDQIRLAGPSARPVPPAAAPEPPHPLIAAESDPESEISVPDDIRIRHSLLRSTREYWRIIRRSNHRWDVPLPPHLVLNVSAEVQARVLRLLQALFAALEHRGYELLAGDRRQIQVKLLGETCELFVRERQRQVRRESTTKGKGPSSAFESSRPFDLVHTGELEFRIEKRYGRQVVRDGKGRPMESLLNEVVVCLLKAALAEKEYRAAQERARLAQLERERRQAIVKQRAREDRARVKRLEQLVTAADHHKRLTVFAAELRDAVGDVEPLSELGRWLRTREGDVERGIPIEPTVGRITFDEAAADLLNDYKANRKRTFVDAKRRIKKHLAPFFGNRRMITITTTELRAFVAKRLADGTPVRQKRGRGANDEESVSDVPRQPVSAGEINRELTVLKSASQSRLAS